MRRALRRNLVVVVAIVVACVGLCWMAFTRDRSIYAPGFSERRFAQVRPGMSQSAVLALLGNPLSEDATGSPETWTYGGEGKWKGLRLEFSGGSCVSFDALGKVTDVRGPLTSMIQRGVDRRQVTRWAGSPTGRFPAWERRLDYSKASSSGRYRARIILIGQKGEVIQTVAYDTYD